MPERKREVKPAWNCSQYSKALTLIPKVGAVVFPCDAGQAAAVLQAEGRLVTLGHLATVQVEDVEGGKHLHAVVVPANGGRVIKGK